MNTLSAYDVRRLLGHLDRVRELTDLLRRAHLDVPAELVYGAAGGEAKAREILLAASVGEVAVEPAEAVN